MIVDLLYGKTGLPVTFDDDLDVTVVAKPRMPLVPDADVAVRQALAVPVGCPPLAGLARGKNSACILICDVTRPVPNGLFLRPLLEALLKAGIDASDVTVLVATGLHRPNLGDELAELVGDAWVLDRVQVVNHYALDDAAHVDFGETRTLGTPVKLDRRFVEADLRIATGLVEPHFMAGYSGGRKVVAPGIAHADTIRTFHSARFIENPCAVQCQLEGNPLHEEQLEIVRMLGDVYALNTVIDDERRLSFVNFGEIVASHAEAVAYADRYLTVPVARRFRTVVTSAAGYPLDQTYYQTVKGMVTPMDILDEDATLILASDCSEGLGSDAFRASQQRLIDLGADAFLASLLEKRFADIDEWESEMQTKAQRTARVRMKSRLNDRDRELTGVELIDSVEEAVRESVEITGDGAVAVIPEGPYVVPRYRPLGG
ncbi:MAG: nickel-dependent lactate racemase [Gammaproteobacteria bacterium]|nr:nickel-dependent lactate racemase [Gammaproteobacteria bacterium]MDE0444970.1 nickel-dependent lactate racemase [Gammaproteobacteria bacterium]